MNKNPTSQILKDLLPDSLTPEDLERERAEADARIEELLSGAKLSKKSGFWTWGLCERLQERSWDLRQHDPKDMLRLARFAVEAAERLSHSKYGIRHVADLMARAQAELANAQRISDQLPLAEIALAEALLSYHKGTRSPRLRARLAEISASLLCDQRNFLPAFCALDFAYSLYTGDNASHDAGRVLITKGLHTGYTGDPEEGIRLLARGLCLIDRDRDPRLPFQALHNILLFRVDLKEFKAARRQIWDMRPLYNFHGERIVQVKLRWIEGKVSVGLGELDQASHAFEQAKEGFLEKGMSYDAALVSFDLATLWLREGRRDEVRHLLQEMLETFRARYVARETVAALIMLRDAADRNELTVDLLEMIGTFFHTFKDEPKHS